MYQKKLDSWNNTHYLRVIFMQPVQKMHMLLYEVNWKCCKKCHNSHTVVSANYAHTTTNNVQKMHMF